MAEHQDLQAPPERLGAVDHHRASLQRSCLAEPYAELATHAAPHAWSPVDSLAQLLEGEADVRRDRATTSRMRLARFPVLKT